MASKPSIPRGHVTATCQRPNCGKVFTCWNAELRKGGGKYCCRKCGELAKKKPYVEKRCIKCKALRGPKAKGEGMCRRCAGAQWGKRGRRHDHQIPHKSAPVPERTLNQPKGSWWIAPREDWANRVEREYRQRMRLKGDGIQITLRHGEP